MSDIIRDIWYLACLSKDLKRGKVSRRYFFGDPVAIGRDENGTAFALWDVCPHRAAPLSAGTLTEEAGEATLICPYHGWRIKTGDGICSKIPALSDRSDFPVHNMRTRRYHLHEEHGLVWIYAPSKNAQLDAPTITPPPSLPHVVGTVPKMRITVPTEGPYDEAVIGLIDPAHTPYVHQQWFWRNPDEAKEKVKEYVPAPMGFKMKAHPPSSNGRAYKLIGGAMTTEIEFQLPGIRLETIKNEKHTVLSFTAITPTREGESEITHVFYWDILLMTLLRPLSYPLAKRFLGQDGHILRLQNQNISELNPKMKYVDDPDQLAKWYLKIKKEWQRAKDANEAFNNPLEPSTLYWRT